MTQGAEVRVNLFIPFFLCLISLAPLPPVQTNSPVHPDLQMTPAPANVDNNKSPTPFEAAHQLQQTLLQSTSGCSPPRSRKHSRASSTASDRSDLSGVTGQFDDADEFDYPPGPAGSPYSKRRRSNDWPRGPEDPSSLSSRKENTSYLWPFHHGRTTGSPRGSARNRHAVPARGRRSRFVEAHMNDSVSEKPPSIYLRDGRPAPGDGPNANGQRSSGIFRFGKAIASAFNPFGAWGNVTEMWRGSSPEANHAVDDPVAQAEKAYAELKKSGYKGTNKGSYLQDMKPGGPDEQMWKSKSTREKTDYKPTTGYHSRQNSGDGHESNTSIRSSIKELRKAKSSLGIPTINATSIFGSQRRRSDDSGNPEVRHQKSRKELQKQAKLLKRVSDLEVKLGRARRELQDLIGEDEVFETIFCQDRAHHRKFVPGALPSLPSERLLHAAASSPSAPSAELARLAAVSENVQRQLEELKGDPDSPVKSKSQAAPFTPTSASHENRLQTSLTADSPPSRKRKSPDPASVQAREGQSTPRRVTEEPTSTPAPDSTRKAKLPKMIIGDSPGSVERKWPKDQPKTNTHQQTPKEDRGTKEDRSRPPLQPSARRSPSSRRKASNSRNRTAAAGVPSLRMKKGRSNLRSASASSEALPRFFPDDGDDGDKENQYQCQPGESTTPKSDDGNTNPNDVTTPSPSPTPNKRKDRSDTTYSYIPPVPPLPKDLAATAAKVDRRLAKEIGQKRVRGKKTQGGVGNGNGGVVVHNKGSREGMNFQWPDDIF
ncbi:hypothetical protein P168DRAFT_286881 [Aspergillus campestris IBT 28561]|uniref:Nuclear RNA binding protein n=1 Tax=Aspergillus campestris (strain IBT 28561) TaxID=1392248 RepID=A0A2I1DG02_ASPC2|nr:uncharacterized protein P168DRAFT_286881 [Aspergillus campestris IBT 28561]PKY08806.1 hypothetical protein P168DRAFT_286881 [Aspergillus campestris IBT 28561]